MIHLTILFLFSIQAHKIGSEFEKLLKATSSGSAESQNDSSVAPADSGPFLQPRINTALRQQAHAAYRKLIKSVYILAANGQPLSSYTTLVQVQKANGVQLIQGLDTRDRAKEFVSYIGSSIRNKISKILNEATAFSILSDGSQARKTASEKELILARTVKNGKPAYFVAGLGNVDDYGDATASNLKMCIDDTFKNSLSIPEEKYTKLVVCATADGASVNTGIYNGLLTRLEKEDRPWLLKIACISHRLELAIKDSLMHEKSFKEAKDLMVTIYYLMKRSGKFQRQFKETGNALGVQVYKFPKVHGTRFVNHQRTGIKILIHNWIPLLLTIENALANKSYGAINAKLMGILKRLTNMSFLATTCLFKLILDIVAMLSLKFEEDDIQPFEVPHAIEMTKMKFDELLEEEESPISKLDIKTITTVTEGAGVQVATIERLLPKPGHLKRKATNREFVPLAYEKMTGLGQHATVVERLRRRAIPDVVKCLEDRMKPFLEEDIFKNMNWLDPANWQEDSDVQINAMKAIAEHFSVTLGCHGFDITKLKPEYKNLRITTKHFYAGVKAKEFWRSILQYRRPDYPNICLLVEVLMAVGISNCTVESGFSFLTAMMSDRRLSMKHETMADLLLIRANHLVWSEKELEDILDCALINYMEKKRKMKLSVSDEKVVQSNSESAPSPSKISRQDSNDSSDSSSDVDAESLSGSETDHDVDSDVESISENFTLDLDYVSESDEINC